MSTNHRIVLDLITSSEQRLERKVEDRIHRVWTQKFDELELKKVEIDRRESRISEREGIVEQYEKLKNHLLEREDSIIKDETEIGERVRCISANETRLSAKENKLSDQLTQIQKEKSEVMALLKKRDKAVEDNRSLEAENLMLQLEESQLQTNIKSLKEKSDTLTQPSDILKTKSENIELTKGNERKAKEIKQLKLELSDVISQLTTTSPAFSITDLGLLHALSCAANDLFYPPSKIVTVGSGPFSKSGFDDYLRTLDVTPRADKCSWIIIGREDWDEERLNKLIDASDLNEVKVFSQELFVAGILTTHDPFSLPPEILMKFAEGHPALEHLINEGFEWPNIKRGDGRRGGWGEKESPLSLMGYHVGMTRGLGPQKRRSILKTAYLDEIEELPDAKYMRKWGRPNQSKRLERIANHIADEISKNQNRENCERALKEWRDDLNWLKKEFYTNRMRFKWPGG